MVDECATYFQRNPYQGWFDPLDTLLRNSAGASYYDGSACHLDLVQWATLKVWSQITPAAVRNVLLEDGVPHLRAQLAQENVRLVLLNGRQGIDQVRRLKLAHLSEVDRLATDSVSYRLYTGSGEGVTWLGWSANLQSSWGISTAFKNKLAAWIAEQLSATSGKGPTPSAEAVDLDPSGYLPQGLRVEDKQGLTSALQHWQQASATPTVGPVAACPRARRWWRSGTPAAPRSPHSASTPRGGSSSTAVASCSKATSVGWRHCGRLVPTGSMR